MSSWNLQDISFYGIIFIANKNGCVPFISFSCVTALVTITNTALNRSGESTLVLLLIYNNRNRVYLECTSYKVGYGFVICRLCCCQVRSSYYRPLQDFFFNDKRFSQSSLRLLRSLWELHPWVPCPAPGIKLLLLWVKFIRVTVLSVFKLDDVLGTALWLKLASGLSSGHW